MLDSAARTLPVPSTRPTQTVPISSPSLARAHEAWRYVFRRGRSNGPLEGGAHSGRSRPAQLNEVVYVLEVRLGHRP